MNKLQRRVSLLIPMVVSGLIATINKLRNCAVVRSLVIVIIAIQYSIPYSTG